MEAQQFTKKKRAVKSENPHELDFVLAQPKGKVDNDELYLYSCEALYFQNISLTNRNLHTIVIIGQSGITSLNGISKVPNLRELWVVECLVKDLSDLTWCHKLQELYLYSNNINEVPNMSNCPELKLLSLSGNKISQLQNFDSMPNLQELYLANNRVKKIGNAFQGNINLSVLNLAENPLYELADVKNLAVLTSLRSIILADPLYGKCPLVSLCNYRNFVVNCFSKLTKLDYYPVTGDERNYAMDVFKSKIMFYNMLWHKYSNNFLQSVKSHVEENYRKIRKYRDEVYLAKLEQLRIAKSRDVAVASEDFSDQILQKIYTRIRTNDASEKQWTNNARMNFQILQQQLILKVQHYGNMNFMEYTPATGNTLVTICQEICNDSLCSTARRDLGISGVHVHRVTKCINNETDGLRWSRYFNDTSEHNRQSESVFKFLVSPVGVVGIEKWPFNLFTQEFFDETELIMSDCLVAADAEWMKRISLQQRLWTTSIQSRNEHRLAILIQLPASVSTMKIDKPDVYHAIHMNYNKDTCQCLSLVKPEKGKPVFAVEYEYIFEVESENITIIQSSAEVASVNSFDICPHLDFTNLPRYLDSGALDIDKLKVINLSGLGISTIELMTCLPNLWELDLSYNKLTVLSDSAMIKCVRKLDVSFNNIRSFEITTSLPMLESLNATWNEIDEFIVTLQMLETFTPNLTTLNVKYNPFIDVVDRESMCTLAHILVPLLKCFNEKILHIPACANPVCQPPWIKDIFETTNLFKLEIGKNAVANVLSETNQSMTSPPIVEAKLQKNIQFIDLSGNRLSRIEFIKQFPKLRELYLANNWLKTISLNTPLTQLTKLTLRGNFIATMNGLTQYNLPVLSYLDLGHNLITSLLTMDGFHSLTEFYCSGNRISKLPEIYNLKNWHGLKIIDISSNPIASTNFCKMFLLFHISKIEYINGQCVTNSDIMAANHTFGGTLDKDAIINMPNVRNLTSLRQLSVVNCTIKKVDLSTNILPNLESLDLRQNQITTLWGLHTLLKLRVLCLSHNRVESSVPLLQKDYVQSDCLFPSLQTLFLDHNEIRSLVKFHLPDMPALKYLYLQRNRLQHLKGLQTCTSLETLVLDHNKIQSITEENFHADNNLKIVFLENNKIKFLCFARRLSKIEKLFVANNKVTDKEQLENLSMLEHLKEITILGNPLCKRTNHYKLAMQAIVTLTHIDGHSVILDKYLTN